MLQTKVLRYVLWVKNIHFWSPSDIENSSFWFEEVDLQFCIFFIHTTVQSPWSGRDQKLWELSDILVDGRISDQSYLQNDLVLKLVTKFWSHSLLLTFWLPRLVVEFHSFWSDMYILKGFFLIFVLEYLSRRITSIVLIFR